jgi:hypothetical protein
MKKFLLIAVIMLGSTSFLSAKPGICRLQKQIEGFNYAVGTQTIGAKYKFTKETNLVETAQAIREMGSNLLKFSIGPRYWWENYDIPKDENINTVTKLAQEKSMKKVLDMDFKYYQIWVYEFSQYTKEPPGQKKDENQIKYIGGLSDEHAEASYKEVYELACYLLKTYSGTGKVFMLGNWEGDWHLRWHYDRTKPVEKASIEGMTRWFNVRQKAIDDAKRDTKHQHVEMYHYVEVNLSDIALEGKDCVINSILPHINPDYVSFSSYTASNPPANEAEMEKNLTKHLNYIESKIQPKKEIKGKRLFIGEYGWPELGYYSNEPAYRTPEEVNQRAKWVIKTALKWGSPFILWWEMYNNELTKDGKNRGFWLINDKGEKTPLYYTHQNFLKEGKAWVRNYQKLNKKMPTQEEFLKAAVEFVALK